MSGGACSGGGSSALWYTSGDGVVYCSAEPSPRPWAQLVCPCHCLLLGSPQPLLTGIYPSALWMNWAVCLCVVPIASLPNVPCAHLPRPKWLETLEGKPDRADGNRHRFSSRPLPSSIFYKSHRPCLPSSPATLSLSFYTPSLPPHRQPRLPPSTFSPAHLSCLSPDLFTQPFTSPPCVALSPSLSSPLSSPRPAPASSLARTSHVRRRTTTLVASCSQPPRARRS